MSRAAELGGGALTVYRWELRKLVALKRTYLGLGAAALVPLAFVIALAVRSDQPNDIPFGRYVHQSGLAIPLVLLTFASGFLLPLITALVAGDIVAAEDHNGTLKTILTRSLERGQIFTGKALAAATYALMALFLMGVVAVVAGGIESGFNSLVDLSGTTVSAARALGLVAASFGVYLWPLLAIACIGLMLSAVTRNSAAAVVGTLVIALLIELIGILPGLSGTQPYLLTRQFDAWQGLLRRPTDWDPIARSAWVCALYGLPSLAVAYLVFLRRDVAGG
jgi:ABC-2 type transport system permease protein